MPAIGITGGVGTGKSTFCQYLGRLMPAAKIFDADAAAHALVDLAEVKTAIRERFGSGVFSEEGDLNRPALGAIIFRDAAKKRALEQILHPRIRRQWSAEAEKHRNSPDFFFADIPLLYETGGENLCDRVVVVGCSRHVQLQRLRDRSIDEQSARQMIQSQLPLAEKVQRADYVIWNNGPTGLLHEQANRLVDLWRNQTWTKA